MKIIGKTESGYLVEASALELANSAGYAHPCEAPCFKRSDSYNSYVGYFPIGAEFKPTLSFDYLRQLRQHEDKVKTSESILRALADMLHGALPTTVIPPVEKDASTEATQ